MDRRVFVTPASDEFSVANFPYEIPGLDKLLSVRNDFVSALIKKLNFEVRHPRCVSNKSNCNVYAYIAKHIYVLGGMLFTIRKAQLHVSATNFGHHQVVQ